MFPGEQKKCWHVGQVPFLHLGKSPTVKINKLDWSRIP